MEQGENLAKGCLRYVAEGCLRSLVVVPLVGFALFRLAQVLVTGLWMDTRSPSCDTEGVGLALLGLALQATGALLVALLVFVPMAFNRRIGPKGWAALAVVPCIVIVVGVALPLANSEARCPTWVH